MDKYKNARPALEKSSLPSVPGIKAAAKTGDAGRTARETIESIVIAFVLAFLFRTFEAEAFVIPTGSMAPTLQGRHKDIVCPKCGYAYRASASSEADEETVELQQASSDPRLSPAEKDRARNNLRSKEVVAVTCPLCRYTMSVDPSTTDGKEHPGYNGDRILVAKFPYEFVEPKRWDVVVFKYPGDAKTNYIKRLVGLPGETVHIEQGNIYTHHEDASKLEIERKSPAKQRAMAQIVYDNDHVVDEMTKKGWPLRWQNWPPAADEKQAAWTSADGGRTFETKGGDTGEQWLRYQHFVPSASDWQAMRLGSISKDKPPKPQLITDYYAYNNGQMRLQYANGSERGNPQALGLHWVGDLMCDVKVEVQGSAAHPDGKLMLDLVEGGKHFRATIDVATGKAMLSIDGVPDFKPIGQTSVKGDGTYKLSFSNFDDQLTLWVGGTPVEFDATTTYGPLDNKVPQSTTDDAGDLAPAGVGTSGGLQVKVAGLRVWRDIYYIADKSGHFNDRWPLTDYAYPASRIPTYDREQLAKFMSTPSQWVDGQSGRNLFNDRQSVEFPLEADQFFVLGDNSPASKDSRLWGNEHFVSRQFMIGKALFIYWPHSYDKLPGTEIPFPYFPNFADMGFVRLTTPL